MADPLPLTDHLAASDEPELVCTPAVRYVAVLGNGSPGSNEFYRKKALLADVARTFAPDGATPVIEIQYWYPEGSVPVGIADFYSVNPIPSLRYRIMTAVSDGITDDDIIAARSTAASSMDDPADHLEVFALPESTAVQVMHHGPFADEFGTLERLGGFADRAGVTRSGPHHEIHLDAFTRQTPQDALRTILRDPVT
ncbi:GyrI-like domain-containing protein [Bremerella alba]|uniref:GyrI-like small molecule binding domain-containing protein n=1 Tax=Bremerella alba TaxID=980252 RepID=A0A7V8V8S4_9BACT|nr:GyrI-like domain-containing protein [Bremerella alba]MBA2117059.1 hypothetical protein [Bremerella alba]